MNKEKNVFRHLVKAHNNSMNNWNAQKDMKEQLCNEEEINYPV